MSKGQKAQRAWNLAMQEIIINPVLVIIKPSLSFLLWMLFFFSIQNYTLEININISKAMISDWFPTS